MSTKQSYFRTVVVGVLVALIALPPSLARAQAATEPGTEDAMARGKAEFDKGVAEFELGNYEKALEHLETAYRLSRRTRVLLNLGVVYGIMFDRTRKIEYLDKAQDRFKSFLQSNPSAEEKAKAEGYLKKAQDLQAKELARRAQGEGFLTVGEKFLQDKRYDEALVQVEQYERTPNNERSGVVRAYLLKGSILAAKGDNQAAADAYARALSLDRGAHLAPDASAAAKKAFAEG